MKETRRWGALANFLFYPVGMLFAMFVANFGTSEGKLAIEAIVTMGED